MSGFKINTSQGINIQTKDIDNQEYCLHYLIHVDITGLDNLLRRDN